MSNADSDSVLQRSFRVLEAFTPRRPELTLDELSAASALSRSTAHRLAHQLRREGALEQTARGWRLGLRLFELGQLVHPEHRLRELALAYMQDLYELTHATIQLAVLDEAEVVYVEILSGHRKVATPSRRGGRMPAHCTALGKVLLGFSPDGGRALLNRAEPFAALTPHTITNPEELAREVREARRGGLAYDREEAALGLRCVAAPAIAASGVAQAAISVSLPVGDPRPSSEIAPALRMAALALSRELRREPRSTPTVQRDDGPAARTGPRAGAGRRG